MQFATFPATKSIKKSKCNGFIQTPTQVINKVIKFLLVIKINKSYNVVIN